MLKEELISIYKKIIEENSITFTDMVELTGLSTSQLASVLKHGGSKVSIEKMEKGLNNLGFGFELKPYNLEENQ